MADLTTSSDIDAFMGAADNAAARASLGITGGGAVLQVQSASSSTWSSTSATIPWDDTLPQSGEGTEFLTCAIDPPASASNILECRVSYQASFSTLGTIIFALFQDSATDAFGAAAKTIGGAGYAADGSFTVRVVAGTTSATTIKLRYGVLASGTAYLNGDNASEKLGGAFITSLTVSEVTP